MTTPTKRPMAGVDRYFAIWAIVLPIASFVLIPFVQGTTPAYLMALAIMLPAVNVVVLTPSQSKAYYSSLGLLVAVYVIIVGIAQLGVSYSDLKSFGPLYMIDPIDENVLLRRTMFTQSLYLLAAASTFVFVKSFYKRSWDRYFMAGALILAIYGLYEVSFFAIFKHNGDFLSNRTFGGQSLLGGGGKNSGSLFQVISLGPIALQRLKSLTGEPSMYAFTILPFWIYAIHTNRKWTHWILFTTLLFNASSTGVAGVALYLCMRFLRYGVLDRSVLLVGIAVLAVALLGWSGNEVVLNAYHKLIVSRFTLSDDSSVARFNSLQLSLTYFMNEALVSQIFGLGFGYVRESQMLSTLLVNMGVVGVILALLIFFWPVVSLGWDERSVGLRAALIVIFVTMMISVPEYGYLSVWLFVGMAYHEMRAQREQAAAKHLTPPALDPAELSIQK